MVRDCVQNLTQLAFVCDDEVASAVVADAARPTDIGAFDAGKVSDPSLAARSAEWARIAVKGQSFGQDLDASWCLDGVDKPRADLGNRARDVAKACHSKFSVGCVATPTRGHPAAPVKLAGGVIAPAMA